MLQLLGYLTQLLNNKLTNRITNDPMPIAIPLYWRIVPEHRWIGVCNEGNHPP